MMADPTTFADPAERAAHYAALRDDADYRARFYLARARVMRADGWHTLAREYVARARQLSRSAREFHREATARAADLLPGEAWAPVVAPDGPGLPTLHYVTR